MTIEEIAGKAIENTRATMLGTNPEPTVYRLAQEAVRLTIEACAKVASESIHVCGLKCIEVNEYPGGIPTPWKECQWSNEIAASIRAILNNGAQHGQE